MATNNSINLKDQGTAYYNGAGSFSGVDGSTAGFVLTSNGTGVAPSFQAAAAGGTSFYSSTFGDLPAIATLTYSMTAGTTSSTTFQIRYGAGGATVYINSIQGSSTLLGNKMASTFTISEYTA